MNEININIGVKGRYRIFKKRNGAITHDTGWFDNLITNQGLNFLSTSFVYMQSCQVGTSSTAPQFTDVALGSRIAGVNGGSITTTIDTTNRYAVHKNIFTFLAGTATGNISEVGVGTGTTGNTLFSRALILDSFGVPTTITVLSDEDLVVVYELYIKQPTSDFSTTVSGQSVTVRACLVNSTDTTRGWGIANNTGEQFIAPAVGSTHAVHSGAIGSITGQPTGTPQYASNTSIVNDSYVADSYTRVGNLRWLPAQANGTWLSASWRFGPTFWQASFSPGITKNSTQSLRIKVRLTWSRDSGPA